MSAQPSLSTRRTDTAGQHFSRPFEDFTVGDSFVTGGRTITETDVVNFSVWTGDMLPSHIDRHWSEQHSLHGRRVANGLLVISYTLGLLPIDHENALALRRIRDVVMKRPTFLDDTIHAEGVVTGLRRLDRFGCVETKVASVNQDGKTVAVGTFDMLWRSNDDQH
nr:MaoC/PaaZ C-terminal domain-containing protein [Rhodococcus sp. (in: high G+C Gram-positive bacteria)]